MSRNPITASERRGIIVLAVMALAVSASGLVLSRCNRPDPSPLPEPEIILTADSIPTAGDEMEKREAGKKKTGKKRRKGDSTKSRQKKERPTRSPLDEVVPPER